MSANPQQADAIKLIGEWSKWMVAVETGAIAVIISLAKGEHMTSHLMIIPLSYSVAILCFMFSAIIAAMVLVSLPAAVQDIRDNDSVWDRPCTVFGYFGKLPFWMAAKVQFLSFVVGVLAFGFGAIASILLV